MSEDEERIIGILKDDMDNLVFRLNNHFEDYMRIFTQKRTRDHFGDVFYSRFRSIEIKELMLVPKKILENINNLYFKIDELYWYVKSTEDMPSMVETRMKADLVKVNDVYSEIIAQIDEQNSFEPSDSNGDFENNDIDLPPPFKDDMSEVS